MTDTKRIDDLRADLSIHRAAAIILENRLDAVGKTWAGALTDDSVPERVHALRVTARRAAAAVRAIGNTLSPSQERRLRKLLRKLRRAAGAARDADVFADRVITWSADRPDIERPGLDILLGATVERRGHAIAELRATIRWRPKWESLRRRLRPVRRGQETLADRAAAAMPKVVSAFERASQMDLRSPRNLHQLRVRGKRLRYALELFVGCYPDLVRDRLYPSIEELQDHLGDAHDAHVHATVVADVRKEFGFLGESIRDRVLPGFDAVAEHLRATEELGPVRFAAWHQQWRQLVASVDFARPMKGA